MIHAHGGNDCGWPCKCNNPATMRPRWSIDGTGRITSACSHIKKKKEIQILNHWMGGAYCLCPFNSADAVSPTVILKERCKWWQTGRADCRARQFVDFIIENQFFSGDNNKKKKKEIGKFLCCALPVFRSPCSTFRARPRDPSPLSCPPCVRVYLRDVHQSNRNAGFQENDLPAPGDRAQYSTCVAHTSLMYVYMNKLPPFCSCDVIYYMQQPHCLGWCKCGV